jgi:hypothetical protein
MLAIVTAGSSAGVLSVNETEISLVAQVTLETEALQKLDIDP